MVSIGTTGEIYIGGAGIAKAYLYREELTQTKFVTIDGVHFYRTGDIGGLTKLATSKFWVVLISKSSCAEFGLS